MTPTPAANPPPARSELMGIVLRVGLFVVIAWLGLVLFQVVLYPIGGVLVAAALTVFFAAMAANAIPVRIFERGRLTDCGLAWESRSAKEFFMGAGAGIGFAALVVGIPLAVREAHFMPTQNSDHAWASFGFVGLTLLFGAAGEELLFHGYAFQLLVRKMGPFATILPTAVLFGMIHLGNAGWNWLGILNTVMWGGVLGYACVRTGALWLPIGLHFGWNLTLPLLGANLSGFTMGMTGYSLEWSAGSLWSGGSYGPEGGLLTTAAVVALAVLLPKVVPQVGEDNDVQDV